MNRPTHRTRPPRVTPPTQALMQRLEQLEAMVAQQQDHINRLEKTLGIVPAAPKRTTIATGKVTPSHVELKHLDRNGQVVQTRSALPRTMAEYDAHMQRVYEDARAFALDKLEVTA